MGAIIVGGVIEKDGKYLLVQEAKEKCRGKWNTPAGHLDPNETIFEGAKREIREESGYEVELTGLANIGNRVLPDNEFVGIIFSAKITGGELKLDPSEILDAKWFTYDEILAMQDELRSADLITNAISAVEHGKTAPLDIIDVIK
ncbi:NUDIX domain-containing protein [Candidatus Saccharibacteria bacterium]|jgi:ADP-ribose pyrophosphatase YjhB (NUDIX family)|nr:NUDIX domain-containing protein [Candidatus Saccharibacteria bacterium]